MFNYKLIITSRPFAERFRTRESAKSLWLAFIKYRAKRDMV